MDLSQRIAQFENMVEADPENEMAHFSLGSAYMEAERFADAAASYLRCTELVPEMSKAFQLAGQALHQAGDDEQAAEVLSRGYVVAAERGDQLPKQGITRLLQEMGRHVPKVENEDNSADELRATGTFVCLRSGRPGTQMKKPPFRGAVGQWIYENISQETFAEWVAQGTKVINELRLDLSRDEDAEAYDRYMYEFLGIDAALLEDLKQGAS